MASNALLAFLHLIRRLEELFLDGLEHSPDVLLLLLQISHESPDAFVTIPHMHQG